MGLYWSVGLPGPFRLGGRVGGKRTRRSRFTSAAYYWSCAFLVEGAFWLVIAAYWLLPREVYRAYRRWQRRRS